MHFIGNLPIDMNSPPVIGEIARLTKKGYEFDIEIQDTSREALSGVVTRIGPQPAIEAAGIKRGDVVSFYTGHIHALYLE